MMLDDDMCYRYTETKLEQRKTYGRGEWRVIGGRNFIIISIFCFVHKYSSERYFFIKLSNQRRDKKHSRINLYILWDGRKKICKRHLKKTNTIEDGYIFSSNFILHLIERDTERIRTEKKRILREKAENEL